MAVKDPQRPGNLEWLEVAQESYQDLYLDRQDQVRLATENARLQHANNVLLQKLATYCRRDFATLPPEILFMVFRNALAPRWLLTRGGVASLVPYPQDLSSIDLRMKRSILSVCRSWNRVGTELLYESVTLRRIAQMPVFVRALEGRDGLGYLVKHLDLNCFVPRGYSTLHHTETKRILKLCPNLSHIAYAPAFWIPDLTYSLPTMGSFITSLEFSETVPYSTIFPSLVELCQTLKCLTLTVPETYDEHPALTFDRLEELRLTLNEGSVVSGLRWRIPNLRQLWLYGYCITPNSIQQIEALLHAYGRPITFLRLPPHYLQLQNALDRCPALKHLVIHSDPGSLKHPTVELVDVFSWVAKPLVPADQLKDGFPYLRSCRNFTIEKAPLWARCLLCRPGSGQHDEKTQAETGEDIDANGIIPASLGVVVEFTNPNSVDGWAVDRTDLSNDYIFNSDDEDSVDGSDTNESDSDFSEHCLEDPFYTEEEWEVNHDEALEIFYRTLED
ncbi:hypothetical protein FB451DRAFT_1412976 [Mycena latifolia]|nr:hypothetical protein FB451DRAFT_1412976 [Mycena latifolia]